MSDYKYGVYGVIGNDIAQNASQAGMAPIYFGTAPVNLLANSAGTVKTPIKISSLSDAQKKLGHFANSADWAHYTLCEAVAAHFNNPNGNVGPIYVINVLDPATHRKEQQTTKSLTFTNRRAEIESKDIIISTLALADKTLDTDYTVSYDFGAGKLVITDIGSAAMTTISATYYEVDHAEIDEDVLIAGITDALKLVYQTCNVIPTYLAAPGWSEIPEVYTALVAASQGINGHWSAFVFADLPIADVTTIGAAKTWKTTNGYTSGFSKVFWPKVKNGSTIFHLSTLALVEKLRCDLLNDNVPFETCGNKSIPVTGLYFGAGVTTTFDKSEANELTAAGIATAVYWESNWRIWGDSTAAFTYGGSHKAREIFDVNMLMLFYIAKMFQKEWGTTIDKPMTLALRDTILNREQEKLDVLVAKGALIGSPKVEFVEENNSTTDMMNGDFRWDIATTNTPPLKSATGVVCYTDAGFSAYFGGEE
jgi:phage tail sheath protein FI